LRTTTPCGGTPLATTIDWISRKASAAARSLLPPTGRSTTTPPVASRRQLCAKARSSARCDGVSSLRLEPMNICKVRSASRIAIGCRIR
jgi:hypothetical protein